MVTETRWRSVWTEMIGIQIRLIQGKNSVTRAFEYGSGDPLILVHGVGGHAETFARNIKNLGKHFRVYAIDARFHGFSSKDHFDPERTAEMQAEAVVDLLDAEGHRWAHGGGESMGSNIAFTMGKNFPDRVGKLILNTGAYFIQFNKTFSVQAGGGNTLMQLSQDSLINFTREKLRARMEWLVVNPDRITDEILDVRYELYSDPEVMESMKRVYGITVPRSNNVRYTEDDVKTLGPPALVFWTDKNPGAGPDVGEYFSSLIPNSEFYCMMDAAHWPQWEHPEEHDRVLIDYLSK